MTSFATFAIDMLEASEHDVRAALRDLGIDPDAAWLVGRCPCGAFYALGVNIQNPQGRRLFHGVPACSRAELLPALGYLQYVRTEAGTLQRRGGNPDLLRKPA